MSRLTLACALMLVCAGAAAAQSPKFYPDDPLLREPAPVATIDAEERQLNDVLEMLNNLPTPAGELHPPHGVILARGVNTLGEVMDGPWFVNRHGARRLSREELLRGPGNDTPPFVTNPLQVLVVKPAGLRPGLLVADARRNLYLLRFDSPGFEELATGAQMVASRFFHALGYHVPENYLVRLNRAQLVASESGEAVSTAGRTRALTELDIDQFLRSVATGPGATYRAVATRLPSEQSRMLGPYQLFGVRSDDPNDVVAHEHRRDLRGLFVFAAWLGDNSMRAVDTVDVILEDDGIPHIRHYLFDFMMTLGSGILDEPKRAWEGHQPLYPSAGTVAANMSGLGIVTPPWMRTAFPKLRGVGHIDYETFDPVRWTPTYSTAPFVNRLPDDNFWAAKLVMAFTDDDIRTIVSTGQYSDPAAAAWLAECLIERRNRIGRAYLGGVLPLDNFRIENGELAFDDLGARYGLAPRRMVSAEWLTLDNDSGTVSSLEGSSGLRVPAGVAAGRYVAARLSAGEAGKTTTVYLRSQGGSFEVVGVDRDWAGKVAVPAGTVIRHGPTRYPQLDAKQKPLFVQYTAEYNKRAGRTDTPQESFDALTLSQQTTFDAVTHALMHSELTDEAGRSLGSSLDLIERVDRIAGQYAGRSGDQQFRLFVQLKPDARDILDKSREFFRDHDNTVYHVGYPYSYRQTGKEPNMQFSLSEDGRLADIDVDYRSSRTPKALFNGHLTAANSDVRAGDNPRLHNGRWNGFNAWWQDTFGRVNDATMANRDLVYADHPPVPTPLPPDRPTGAAPDRIEDAVQEFLSDWLVRQHYDEALDSLSPRAYACLNIDEDAEDEALSADQARMRLRELMEYTVDELGRRAGLTDAIVAVQPNDPARIVLDHPFRREFMITPVSDREAQQYLCGQAVTPPDNPNYYGVLFSFRGEDGGALGLLWNREGERWRLVSYRIFSE